MSAHNNQTTIKYDSIFGLMGRLFWKLWGNLILMISAIVILQYQDKGLHAADVVFWTTVMALVLVRYLDVKLWNGDTWTGKPASIANWRRYSLLLTGCAAVVWTLCHLIVYFAK